MVQDRLHNGVWSWEEYQSLFCEVTNEKAIGESTVLYLYYFKEAIQNIKYRGSTARIHFAINNIPKIKGINPNQMGTNFSICSTLESLERASDGVKYGSISDTPYVEFNIPSMLDPDFTQSDKHVLSATVQYAPYHLRNDTWDKKSNDLLEKNTIKVIDKFPENI